MDETKVYNADDFQNALIDDTLRDVIKALEERGYNPINQIVGYLMSGDPGYISSYKDSRTRITKFPRTRILEILVRNYIKK